jgi:hypothetical protein
LAFGRWAEGQIKKWIDYSKGALLFVMVPDDPESGMFCVYDRKHQAFWMVDPVAISNFGGYRSDLWLLDCEILYEDQRFNSLDQKSSESVEESALVTRRFTLS